MHTIEIKTAVPSVNSLYRGRRFLTKEGKQTKVAISYEIRTAVKFEPHKGSVALNVLFYFPDKRKRDIDNCLKSLLDCCTGILFEDDSQIEELHVYKQVDVKNPRTIIQIL